MLFAAILRARAELRRVTTRGRIAIFINPFRVLCAERVVYLALKLGVTRNFGDEDGRMRCVHRLSFSSLCLPSVVEEKYSEDA
jgi:hypothetical protein